MSNFTYCSIQAKLMNQFCTDHKEMTELEASLFWTQENAKLWSDIFRPLIGKKVNPKQLKKAFREFDRQCTK